MCFPLYRHSFVKRMQKSVRFFPIFSKCVKVVTTTCVWSDCLLLVWISWEGNLKLCAREWLSLEKQLLQMNLDQLRTSTEKFWNVCDVKCMHNWHTSLPDFERRRAENLTCSTRFYHLMEMKAKLTNHKLIRFEFKRRWRLIVFYIVVILPHKISVVLYNSDEKHKVFVFICSQSFLTSRYWATKADIYEFKKILSSMSWFYNKILGTIMQNIMGFFLF